MAKAGRPKKGSAGLPDWFDIQKYALAKTYDAERWYQQLAFRYFIRSWLLDEGAYGFLGTDWLEFLQHDPHVTVERMEKSFPPFTIYDLDGENFPIRGFPFDELFDEVQIEVEPAYGVKAATNGDIYDARKHLPDILQKPLSKKIRTGKDEKSLDIAADWYHQRRNWFINKDFSINESKKFACVDFSLPDAILRKRFDDYIRLERPHNKAANSPYLKNTDFEAWYNSGVLPYLDLCLWELATEQSFQWSSFVNALNDIVDRPIGSEDACRKTVKGHTEKLMNKQTLRMLNFQASREQISGAKKSGTLFVR